MSAYADSSFLVSLFAPDAHSTLAAELLRQVKPAILLTYLGELELENALHLRVFRKQIHRPEALSAYAAFRKDVEEGLFVLNPINGATYSLAHHISRRHTSHIGARALDILHVAAARVLTADNFLSFDERQKRLAHAEGLRTP